jgi:hypothetical protein
MRPLLLRVFRRFRVFWQKQKPWLQKLERLKSSLDLLCHRLLWHNRRYLNRQREYLFFFSEHFALFSARVVAVESFGSSLSRINAMQPNEQRVTIRADIPSLGNVEIVVTDHSGTAETAMKIFSQLSDLALQKASSPTLDKSP